MVNKGPTEIEDKVAKYRQRLVAQSSMPPPDKTKAQRIMERIGRIEVTLQKTDERRLRALLDAAKLKAATGDLASVYGYCAEVMLLCRTQILGVNEAHPVPRTMPPMLEIGALPSKGEPETG